MRRAAGLSPEAEKRSSCRMCSRDPRGPQAAGSQWLSPPIPPEIQGCQGPPARTRHVVFEDEVVPLGRPPGRVPTGRPGPMPTPPRPAHQPRAIPDYVVKYPAIRSHRQRESYKGVFQDQLAEYTELLQEDSAFLEKQQRCEYLKKKLTHIKARIQEYDCDTLHNAVSRAPAPAITTALGR